MTSPAPTAVVLAAHGECGGGGANERTYRLAAELAEAGGWAAVAVGFFKTRPPLEDALVLAAERASRVVVCPLLMADGYFARKAIRASLRQADPAPGTILMAPIGCEPELQRLAHARAWRLAAARGWDRPSVVVVGHGTRRDPRSRRSTQAVAAGIAADPDFAGVTAAFLDEEPGLAAVLAAIARPTVVVPYLWSAGRHGGDDLRRAVAAADGPVALDRPVGQNPEVGRILLNALWRATRPRPEAAGRPSPPNARRSAPAAPRPAR